MRMLSPWSAVLGLLLWAPQSWASSMPKSLACGLQKMPNAVAICRLLEANMDFEWLGHVTVAPGYRVTFATVRKVWCARRFSAADVPALVQLETSTDWRLEMGAKTLRILTEKTPHPPSSIYHPDNPQYILRKGCSPKS
ncbi:MAG: hypothetical protein V4858_10625 [Pseudomonadota bacterium]